MNTGLWVLQGLLAFAFVGAGLMKLTTARQKLSEKGQKWAADFSDGQVKLIGLAELLGGVGLVVPWATGILPILTPVAAVALIPVMSGAVMTERRVKGHAAPPMVLGVLSLLVAIGRSGLVG